MKKNYYEQNFLRLNHKEEFLSSMCVALELCQLYRPGLCLEVEQNKGDILFISRQILSNFSSLFFLIFIFSLLITHYAEKLQYFIYVTHATYISS